MKIIAGGRGQGKTTKLIKEAYDNNGVIVCRNKTIVQYIIDKASNMGCLPISTCLIDEIMCCHPDTKFYIDDYDWFVKQPINWNDLSYINIEAVTMTSDDVVDLNKSYSGINITINVNNYGNNDKGDIISKVVDELDKVL